MKLSGNRFVQQKAVEHNMEWHYKRLRNPSTPNPDFCRWTPQNPKPVPSKTQRSRAADAKKQVKIENERLMTKLFEIFGDTKRTAQYSPEKCRSGKKDLVEEAKEIRAKATAAKNEQEMKRIDEENQKLLSNITTMKPMLNLREKERDYKTKKALADTLRKHTSHTALHLLASPGVLEETKPCKTLSRPKSAGLLPSWYRNRGQQIYPYSDKQSRSTTPKPDRASYVRQKPYPTTAQHHLGNKRRPGSARSSSGSGGPRSAVGARPSSACAGRRNDQTRQPADDAQEAFEMLTEKEVRRRLYGKEHTEDSSKVTYEGGGASGFIDGFADISVQNLDPLVPPSLGCSLEEGPRLMELATEKSTVEAERCAPVSPKSRRSLLTEMEMRGVLVGEDMHATAARSQTTSAQFVVRLYDVGMTCSAGYFNTAAPHPNELVATSSGILVESRTLPETEKTLTHELLLPIKQLKLLADRSSAPGADSLCRKLRRLRCVNRERGLFAALSSEFDPAGQELLCELLFKSIETVITVHSGERRDSGGSDTWDNSQEFKPQHRGHIEIRLKNSHQ